MVESPVTTRGYSASDADGALVRVLHVDGDTKAILTISNGKGGNLLSELTLVKLTALRNVLTEAITGWV